MKTKIIFFATLMLSIIHAQAQITPPIDKSLLLNNDTSRIHNWYRMNASEIIFSGGQVESNGVMLDNIVRFTAFFHFQQQFHYNFNNTFGLFTGFGVRNVGFINKIAVPADSAGFVTVKQRSYSFGIPLALKIGNMTKGEYLALGAEAELMFAYKEKILYNDQKYKNYSWFSNNVNLINPSVFADIRFQHGSYIRFKYYLLDFLKNKDMSFLAPETTTYIYYRPTSSKLFYVAIGTSFRDRKHKKKHATQTDV